MKYDLIIIGSGPAGYVAAVRASQLGKSVALVEKAEAGGTCLNWGCIPTKALLKSAQVYSYCKSAANYGVDMECEPQANLSRMVARSRTVAQNMNKGVQLLLKRNNVEILNGFGRLVSPTEVDVKGVVYQADNIILATGARPREMAFMPVDHTHIINSKDALSLEKLPQTMVVVGSGAIGSEFAFFYASLGVKVTVIEYMPQLMPLEDEEVAKTMERVFRRLRIGVMTSTTVKSVAVVDDKCQIEIEGKKGTETLTADVVLSAVGIKSNIENIGLEQLGIAVERDKIVVDSNFRTNIPTVYAVGDIIATPALAHIASTEAIRCVEGICGLSPKVIDYSTIPSCIFTTPEVASVGITEKQAVEQGIEHTIGRYQFAASGKAMAAGDRDGFVKIIFDSEKRVIGAHIMGANIVEMLGEVTLAKELGITAEQIAHTIHAHPAMYEGIAEAAEQALGCAIHA